MLRSVSLRQFRSYTERQFRLSPGVTLISGPNGSGKTNILEALYVAAKGSSFRGSDTDLLQFNQPWWRIDVADDDSVRTVLFDASKTSGRKQFIVNGVKKLRLGPLQKLPVVLFEPDDLRLLHGSPARRRAFIDTFIAQLEPSYATHVGRYDRALRQRNNLLKTDHTTPDELFVWDMTLSEIGAYLISKRFTYVQLLNESVSNTYQSLSETNDIIDVKYTTFIQDNVIATIRQRFLAELHAAHKKDIVLGFTTVGPHRDDVEFIMNGSAASATASRGETRSIVLSLKLIEIEHVIKNSERTPLLLLDDVFSELDASRRQALVNRSSSVQTVITTTDADIVHQNTFPNTIHISTANR